MTRVRADVGAEAFPNIDRRAVDVAAAMISTARAARQDRVALSTEELLRRAKLRSDFGAVSRAHPVDHEREVLRPTTVRAIVEVAGKLSNSGGHLLVVGPPGQGKSWVCQQVLNALSNSGWLTAEHYCYLGDADSERNERVLSQAVFGSLVGRLAAADPRLVLQHRPRFAADEEALEACLRRSLEAEPQRRVAVVVDGLDHITRVRSNAASGFDPSRGLAEDLAALDLPEGSVMVLLSQPGSHLDPLEQVGAKTVNIPGLRRDELALLAARLNVLPDPTESGHVLQPPLLEDADGIARFVDALEARTSGNALYATYLCHETLRRSDISVDPAATIRSLPQFDGSLKNYYDHLCQALDSEAGWVADVIALVNFAVTRAELRQIRPDAAHRVDAALALLAPVLVERATQGGVRVYHESFARYLRGAFDRDALALTALLGRIADWLQGKGLYADPRAFRSLLAVLAEAGNHRRVVELVDREFVARAVAAGFPSSAIVANLAIASSSAAALGEWSLIVRYVELARAAESYQSERFDSTLVDFADVAATLLGASTLAARLLDDDRLVMPARAGLQMCAAVDRLGATAPWKSYMVGHLRESKSDNTAYDEVSNQALALAWMRGRLRLATTSHGPFLEESVPATHGVSRADRRETDESGNAWDLEAPIDWDRLGSWIEQRRLPMPDVVSATIDICGIDGVIRLISSLDRRGEACLAFAERLATGPALGDAHGASPRLWAIAATAHGIPAGSLHRILRLGVDPALAQKSTQMTCERLLALTRQVQEPAVRFESGDISEWLDACSIAAHLDDRATRTAELAIVGEGWYRCWLRFVLALSRAEAAHHHRGTLAMQALRLLTDDVRPFVGDPRACDLYSLHVSIRDTITRAMQLLDDAQWASGLRVLKDVSDSITTTLFGGVGGPVPPDLVLRLAVEGATASRREAAEALVAQVVSTRSGRRYYSDLAEYRLFAARLALVAGKTERAAMLWREACAFLTAYGFHKDITIYELLDPLPVLIAADPARGRLRVQAVQGLCERVPLHTDRRETRHAWSRWWELLGKADPVAAIFLAVPALLRHCNDPNWLLDGALVNVWEEWHDRVDPLVSGAFRLTLASPLDGRDAIQIQRLAGESTTDRESVRRLMTLLLARADERPVAYSYSNSAELLARDDSTLSNLNRVAAAAEVPTVSSLMEGGTSTASSQPDVDSLSTVTTNSSSYAVEDCPFPPGMPGLTRAIRAWRRTPYDARSGESAVDRFANVIGYRLLELAADGRQHEAASSLRSLGESVGFGDRPGILRSVAEGLERHGETRFGGTGIRARVDEDAGPRRLADFWRPNGVRGS